MVTRPFGPPAAVQLPELPAGTVLAERFELIEKVAEGGMGVVFAARDKSLGRRVAVKVLRPACARLPGFTARFEREARLAAKLQHANCVTLLDSGRSGEHHFLVLEWLEGATLFALVERSGAMQVERAAGLTVQVCEALAAVHGAGLVHRDVKPENVIVCQGPNGRETAKLIDFGITVEPTGGEPRLTQAGMRMGSAAFMSPEHVLGQPCDARSDVYSTGAMLFFLLTARWPYLGDDAAILRQHISAPAPYLSGALTVTGGPHPFQPIIDRAMAKLPDDRYATTLALAEVLQTTLRKRAAPKGGGTRARIAAAAAFGVITLIAVVGGLRGTRQPSDGRRVGWSEAGRLLDEFARINGLRMTVDRLDGLGDGYEASVSVTAESKVRTGLVWVDAVTGEVRWIRPPAR